MKDEAKRKKKFVIIDGKSVFYRGFYAMPHLSTAEGTPTGGVYGFAVMALEVIKRFKPDYVAVAWDKPKTNIRQRLELYPQYKAGRKKPPADFYSQIPLLQELLQAFGWPLYELDDYEADDIMGALAVQASKKNIETLIVTSDLDMLQLVNSNVKVYALKTGLSNIELYSPVSFEAKYGLKVEQFLDYKAIKGDNSDNIPGIPGIGEKGAVELLQQYQTLDNVYENLVLIKDSLRKKLEAGKDLAYLSKQLAMIWVDAPIKLDLNEVNGSHVDPFKIKLLLEKLEFRNLAQQLPAVMTVPAVSDKAQSLSFLIDKTFPKARLIKTQEDFNALSISYQEIILIHSYTEMANQTEVATLIVQGINRLNQTLNIIELNKFSDKILADKLKFLSSCKVVGYDTKKTLKLLYSRALPLPIVEHDVLIGAFLLNSLRREQTLTELATADLGYQGQNVDIYNETELVKKSSQIMTIIHNLYDYQQKKLKEMPKVQRLAKQIEWPVISVLAEMESQGIELDIQYLNKFSLEVDQLINKYEEEIYSFVEQKFNIASPSQLADVLFNKLQLPTLSIKKGKTGFSTAASELDKLRGQHPIIEIISQYREVAKLKSTYIDALPKLVDHDSRLHTTFNLTIAQTGRLSSTDPNLQNIPIRTELGRHIRTAFIAGQNNKLISADYSQFELRLAAVLADDQELIELFNSGTDIHVMTAAQIYSRNPEDVTKQMRRAAKTINFGILYGMSPHGLSVATGMTREQAVNFIERYKQLRKPLFNYMDRILDQARKDHYVETLFGRRRPMPDITSTNFMIRQGAERAAINMPIQGTEADLMKMAMVECHKLLTINYPNSLILLQIHDSLVVQSQESEAPAVAALLQETMQSVYSLPVKLDVDVTIGDNWGEL